MSIQNMHAVEESIIGALYDKAKYHRLYSNDQPKKFYYTRQGGALDNFYEMIGTRNLLEWLVPLPHSGRQYLPFGDPTRISDLYYMCFDRETLKELIRLEYKIEKRIDDDLIKSGFRIKRRLTLPSYVQQMIGEDITKEE
jgi:hypothetical protein